MKIIHCLSNWKWTERSELVIDLALAQSRLGREVTIICGKTPSENRAVSGVAFNARQKGLRRVIAIPEMTKHWRIARTRGDVAVMRRILLAQKPDVVHCHMRNAHLLAGLARRKQQDSFRLVRSVYNPEKLGRDWRSRWCYRRATDGLVVVGKAARESALDAGFPSGKIAVAEPGVDLDRFSPDRLLPEKSDARRLDVSGGDNCFVAGVVSRIRSTRRLDIPLEAVFQLHSAYPRLKLFLVGHGRAGAYKKVVEEPVQRLGLSEAVIRAGYCRGDDLVEAYRRMQVLLYPMAGTDKTCRTVREAMASAVPVIASRRGFLPELIDDGKNGYLVEPDSESFAGALKKLLDCPEKQRAFSQWALFRARKRFSLPNQAEKILQFYQCLLSERG